MLDYLLLLSGNDIPFPRAQINIHQPTLKEIAYIGEEAFFTGCELLNFSKKLLSTEDKINLENKTDFEIFMSIMNDKNTVIVQKNRDSAMLILMLIFPEHEIAFLQDKIALKKDGEISYITKLNYQEFKQILQEVFCLNEFKDEKQDYNPGSKKARELAEKFKKRHEKLNEVKPVVKEISVLNRYVSILAVGEQKDMRDLLQLTVYQLFDEHKRFKLKDANDFVIKAKLAGVKDIKEVDNWMKDFHSES